jgi:thiol:disulfide interchange protein DsbD
VAAVAPPAPVVPRTVGNAVPLTWVLALLAAVVGGLILNLMPCVLPVLAIKMFSLVRNNHHSRASQRAQGAAYAAGVVLSFMALGGLMLALRATGEQLGWGFQLQSPAVVAALAALFTLLALNLAGVFELGHVLPAALAGLQMRHPMVDAFLTGVLAVAVASPCTAPFMGASLGYAIGLPSAQALAIFAALGFGLALPFLAASWAPKVAHWLPKPGAWMDTLRHFMAFPMLATVVWLVWVLGHLSGVDGAASLLLLLLALAWVVWSLGLRGKTRRVLAIVSIAASAGLLWAIGQNVIKMEPIAAAMPAAAGDPVSEGSVWQVWAPGRVDAELAQGKPVFVDFTAAWCITCQYNKKTTLTQPALLADFQARKVTLLRADWTRRDPAITQALEQLGRSGVPVYVLYQAGRAPVVFSEILSAQALHDALAQL